MSVWAVVADLSPLTAWLANDAPPFLRDSTFWLILGPALLVAFALGLSVRPVRRVVSLWQGGASAVDPVLGRAASTTLTALSQDVVVTPETAQSYLALGALFRERGEFDRASAIHRAIAQKEELAPAVKAQAVFAQAEDFTAAGVHDRAEQLFRRVLKEAGKKNFLGQQALLALARLMERQQRWADALTLREELTPPLADAAVVAQLWVKVAATHTQAGDRGPAERALKNALAAAPTCTPAVAALASLYVGEGKPELATAVLQKYAPQRPALAHVLAPMMVQAFVATKELAALERLWEELCAHPHSTWPVAVAYAAWLNERKKHKEALRILTQAYDRNPAVIEAAAALSQQYERLQNPAGALTVVNSHLTEKAKRVQQYRCGSCGYGARAVFWQCPQCLAWDRVQPIVAPQR